MHSEHRYTGSEGNEMHELYYNKETGLGNNKFCDTEYPDAGDMTGATGGDRVGTCLIASKFECGTEVLGISGVAGSDSGGCHDSELARFCQ